MRSQARTAEIPGSIGAPGLLAIACMNAAELILISFRTAVAAVRADHLLARAELLVKHSSEIWASIQYLQALTSLLRGDTTRALKKALAADAAASALENSRIRASAVRSLAEIRAQCGEISKATDLVHEAIGLSERCGNWGTLSACFRVAAKVTGERRFIRRALELDYRVPHLSST